MKKLIENNVKVDDNGRVMGNVIVGPYTYNNSRDVDMGDKHEAYFAIDMNGISFDELIYEAAQSPRITHTNTYRQFAEIRENGTKVGTDEELADRCERFRDAFETRNGKPVVMISATNPASLDLPMTPEAKRDELLSDPDFAEIYRARINGVESDDKKLQIAEQLYAMAQRLIERRK